MAVSRRLGDEIHPWPPNGDFRPLIDIRVWAFEWLLWRTYRTNYRNVHLLSDLSACSLIRIRHIELAQTIEKLLAMLVLLERVLEGVRL